MSSFKLKPPPPPPAPPGKVNVAFTASPRPAPVGPRQLEKKAEARDETIVDAARTNKQVDTNATQVANPATKTAGPTFKEELPWAPPPAPPKPFKVKQ